jgi:DNA-binding NtrC family response regulator
MATFLIIDDNENDRLLLAATLKAKGHKIVELESGRGALAAVNAHNIDGVALDLIMPDVEGAETLQLLSKNFPSLPIVVMSGLGKDYLPMMEHLGAYAVVEKQADFFEVSHLLERAQG